MKHHNYGAILFLIFNIGCADDGYAQMLIANSFPSDVNFVVDYESGQTPQKVVGHQGLEAYSINVDDDGTARINCTWPISRFHRTFLVLPNETLSSSEFLMIMEDVRIPPSKINGDTSTGPDQGTIYSYTVQRRNLFTPIVPPPGKYPLANRGEPGRLLPHGV